MSGGSGRIRLRSRLLRPRWALDPRHPLLPELEIRVNRAERLRHMLLRAVLEATNSADGTQTRRLA
jgi:hypothetical protein